MLTKENLFLLALCIIISITAFAGYAGLGVHNGLDLTKITNSFKDNGGGFMGFVHNVADTFSAIAGGVQFIFDMCTFQVDGIPAWMSGTLFLGLGYIIAYVGLALLTSAAGGVSKF